MQTSRRNWFLLEAKSLVLIVLGASLVLLAGCSGSSSANYPPPTTQNPTPGVTLQKIQITPSSSIILLAESRQLSATGIYSDGSSVDITSQVKWSASSQPSTTNVVTISSSGVAIAAGVGTAAVSATVGSVTGLLDLAVTTNGFTSGTMAILSVPYKITSVIDVGYLPQQTAIQGAYAVQEVNLDADQFSSVLPVPLALMASIPMPSGFVPNAAAASQSSSLVAVISYSSPKVQIIDASNNPLDLSSNTVTATFTSPVTQSVTINGISCMICAAVVNPLNNQLILSTAQGFYSMDLVAGKFTAMPFTPAPFPAANITVNPAAASPYILSTSPANGAVQFLDLTTNAVTTYSNVSPAPTSAFIDLITNFAAITDATGDQTLLDLSNLQSPQFFPQTNVGLCPGGPGYLNMLAMGVSANAANHTLLTSQTGGSCIGIEIWPAPGFVLSAGNVFYGYGPLPATPDGNPFTNGNDPNAIATFASVVDKKYYGVLVDANQQWIAKINYANAISLGNIGGSGVGSPALPIGALITPPLSAGVGGDAIVFLPSPSTNLTLSAANIDFGSVSVGTQSPQIEVTVANIGTGTLAPQISIAGANAGDFSYISNCSTTLLTQTNCPVYVTFTPAAQGARSATLTVTSTGLSPQTIPLTGTGT